MRELCEKYNNKYIKFIYCVNHDGVMITNTYDNITFDNGYIIFNSQDHSAILRINVIYIDVAQLKFNIDKIVLHSNESFVEIYGEKK